MIEYLLLGLVFILTGIYSRQKPDTITQTLIVISRTQMRIERWRFVWRFLGKYLIIGGIVLTVAGICLHFTHAYL